MVAASAAAGEKDEESGLGEGGGGGGVNGQSPQEYLEHNREPTTADPLPSRPFPKRHNCSCRLQ